MFKKILVPIDLHHADKLAKARQAAIDLAGHYGAELLYVGVTTSLPGGEAHTPAEFEAKLKQLVETDTAGKGITADAHVVISHDPTADLDGKLLEAVRTLNADLVVMATHVPDMTASFWQSNGGWLANHAGVSVFLIRSS
ncbi:universal stress protein [Roseibium sp.]|uniref:universal stress protein n=1 Tax=Roseibium sp. TaxID=1936156 RepID=UPI003A978602